MPQRLESEREARLAALDEQRQREDEEAEEMDFESDEHRDAFFGQREQQRDEEDHAEHVRHAARMQQQLVAAAAAAGGAAPEPQGEGEGVFQTRAQFCNGPGGVRLHSDESYGEYVESVLKAGMRVRAIGGTRAGDSGTYVQTNGGRPPCQCRWDSDGETYWVRAGAQLAAAAS